MPTYIFQAKPYMDPQFNRPIPFPPGTVVQFVLIMPGPNGAYQRSDLIKYVQQFRLGTPRVTYGIKEVDHSSLQQPIVINEIVQAPQLSGVHYQGGQPTGSPAPQGGAPRPDAPRETSGFQAVGDSALDGGIDGVYGDQEDYTVSDIVVDGAGSREVRR